MGRVDTRADGDGFAPPAENKTHFISCGSRTPADTGAHTLIPVGSWRAPDFASERAELRAPSSVRTLRRLLRGELRLGAQVVRVAPAANVLELADGYRYVYDKLLSTLSLAATELLVEHDLPRHVRRDDSLRYWLSDHDIELADRATQDCCCDLDEFDTGKRFAGQIGQALAEKFGNPDRSRMRGSRLFEPRVVTAAPSTP